MDAMSILDKRNTVVRGLRALKRKDGIGEEHNGGNGNGNIEWIDVGVEGLLNFNFILFWAMKVGGGKVRPSTDDVSQPPTFFYTLLILWNNP